MLPKRNIDWPQDFVPSIKGEYDKIELPEFISGFLIMIKSYDTASKDAMLAHLELLTIKAISYSWVGVRAFHKFITKQVEQHRFWIGKIFSLFRIRPPLFSAIQIYGLRTNAQPRTLGYLLTLPPLAIIHKRLHPLLPRLVELGIILAFATVMSKMLMLIRNIIDVECARLIILCYTALNVVHRFPRNDSYSTTPLTLRPL